MYSPLSFLSISGISIAIFTLFLLLKIKNKYLHEKLLIVLIAACLDLFLGFLAFTEEIDWLLFIVKYPTLIFEFLFAPTLLIFIKSFFETPKGLIKRNLIHYVSILIWLLFNLVVYFLFANVSNEDKGTMPIVIIRYIYEVIPNVYITIYSLICLRLIKRNVSLSQEIIADNEKYNFNWLRNLIIGLLILILIDFIALYFKFNGVIDNSVDRFILLITASVIFFYLSYNGVTQPRILLPEYLHEHGVRSHQVNEENKSLKDAKDIIDAQEKKIKSPIFFNEQEVQHIRDRLECIFVEHKPHLNPSLTIHDLAKLMKMSSKKISLFLNSSQEMTFSDFINSKRIDCVKAKINNPDYDKFTLIAIANECGFNSKTTFNRAFKKNTGMSPSKYKEKSSNIGNRPL